MKARLAIVTVLLAMGCGESDFPSLLIQPGDPCRGDFSFCVDDTTIRECAEGEFVERDCEEVCSDLGPAVTSTGCEQASVENLVEGCRCEPEAGTCYPGDTRCDSETELGYCDDQQVWTNHVCDDLCADSLATPVSVGCDLDEEGGAACWCVAE